MPRRLPRLWRSGASEPELGRALCGDCFCRSTAWPCAASPGSSAGCQAGQCDACAASFRHSGTSLMPPARSLSLSLSLPPSLPPSLPLSLPHVRGRLHARTGLHPFAPARWLCFGLSERSLRSFGQHGPRETHLCALGCSGRGLAAGSQHQSCSPEGSENCVSRQAAEELREKARPSCAAPALNPTNPNTLQHQT